VGDGKCRDPPLRSKASVVGEGTGCPQPRNFPGSQRTTCRHRMARESTEPLVGCLGVGDSKYRHTAKATGISRSAAKSGCACEWGGWGRLSEDGSGQNNPDRNEGPWGRAVTPLERRCSNAPRPSTQNEEQDALNEEHEGWRQTARREDLVVDGKAPSENPALKP